MPEEKRAAEQDGVHGMVPGEHMFPAARKLRETYAITPGAPFFKREFVRYYCWMYGNGQGLPPGASLEEVIRLRPARQPFTRSTGLGVRPRSCPNLR